jgi:Flp pilus assembly protein TadG
MRSFLNFLRDDKGSQSFEFLLWVPIFVALLIIVMDATTHYISQTEMENVARDTARRIVKGLSPDLARTNALNSMSLRDLPYSVVATFDPAIGADVTIAVQSKDKSMLAYSNVLMMLGTNIGARVIMRPDPTVIYASGGGGNSGGGKP